MKKLQVIILLLLLVPSVSLAQAPIAPSGGRVIIEKEALQTPVEVQTKSDNKKFLYGLGAVILVVVAVLAARSLIKNNPDQPRKTVKKIK